MRAPEPTPDVLCVWPPRLARVPRMDGLQAPAHLVLGPIRPVHRDDGGRIESAKSSRDPTMSFSVGVGVGVGVAWLLGSLCSLLPSFPGEWGNGHNGEGSSPKARTRMNDAIDCEILNYEQ